MIAIKSQDNYSSFDGSNKSINIIIPCLCISGGIFESLNLGKDFSALGYKTKIISLWGGANHVVSNFEHQKLTNFKPKKNKSITQYFFILLNFIKIVFLNKESKQRKLWMFTHYSTFPLSFFIPRERRIFFVQGLEWGYFKNKFFRFFLKKTTLFLYSNSKIITANNYLTSELNKLGLTSITEMPIWANSLFYENSEKKRDIDFIMVLRKGSIKRNDLYCQFIKTIKNHNFGIKIAVITPDEDLITDIKDLIDFFILSPSISLMRDVYSNSKCFILLSDHEGFGLPPLEAMGSGCVPICRDSIGVRAYMKNSLSRNLISLDKNIDYISDKAINILKNEQELKELSDLARKIFISGLDTYKKRLENLSLTY